MTVEATHHEQEEPPLRQKLRELSKYAGVRRGNLYDFLEQELRALWHISNDSPQRVLIKVTWQLEQLISQLPQEEHRLAARYSFNITGVEAVEKERDLGGRQEALARRREYPHPSGRATRNYMAKVILPQFEDSLRNEPPQPVPQDVIDEVERRVAAGEQISAVMASLVPGVPQPSSPAQRRRLVPAVGLALLVILVGGAGLVVWLASSDGTTGDGQPNGPTAGSDPGQSPPGTSQQIAGGETVAETCGVRVGCPVFNDPNTPTRSAQQIEFMQEVEVACRVYAPSLESVEWWYRLVSEPYNNEAYAPAVNFLNGDPVEGPYEHDVDEGVREC